MPAAAHAANVYVAVAGNDTTGTGSLGHPYATVQKAVTQATANDVICVGPGTFTGNVTMKHGVSLRGAGASMTTLRGTGSGSVITATSMYVGETISGFTITGGNGNTGGAIYAYVSPRFRIEDNTITGNAANLYGGAIYLSASSPVISGNTITSNVATGSGGAIYCESYASTPTISNNTITGNTSGLSGGGICCDLSAAPTIADNVITGNSARGTYGIGGGISCGGATLMVTNNIVCGNTAIYYGGGIACNGSSVIAHNAIGGNRAPWGAGICDLWGNPAIDGNTVVGNEASTSGGGIWFGNAAPVITNNVIAGNRATASGGGMTSSGASGTVSSNTLYDNRAPSGGGIYRSGTGTPTITNCVIWANTTDLFGATATYSDISAGDPGTGNISADPGFVAPASGDFRLVSGSPCSDHASSPAAPAKDKDGISRPWGLGPDMGAYEFYVPAYVTRTSLAGPSSVKVRKSLRLTGAVSPAGASPYAAPGKVTITKMRLFGRKWRSAGTAKVNVVSGSFSYAFTPTARGKWRFVVSYSGGIVGPTAYLSSKSGTKGVTVK